MHPRRAIRAAFKNRLLNATAADDRVRTSIVPLDQLQTILVDEGPIIFVFARNEEIRPEDYPTDGFDGAVRRTLTVTVEGCLVGYDADDKADDLAEEIEALFEDFTVPDMEGTEIRLVSTDVDATDAFESILGGCLLTYEVKYWSEYRKDESEEFRPEIVWARIRGQVPTEKVVDDTDDVWP